MSEPRLTLAVRLVLRELLINPSEPKYGRMLGERAELPSGTIHPILARLEAAGWVDSEWEKVDPHNEGRPRRRNYWLTGKGQEKARDALARRPVTSVLEMRSTGPATI